MDTLRTADVPFMGEPLVFKWFGVSMVAHLFERSDLLRALVSVVSALLFLFCA